MRVLRLLVLSLLAAASLIAVPAAPAQAVGGESMLCAITPQPSWPPYYSQDCSSSVPSDSYYLNFQVFGGSGTYTYSWNWLGGTPAHGCTSTSNSCGFALDGRTHGMIQASVTITQGAYSTYLFAAGSWESSCPWDGGWIFC